ncbi:hypothetical protein BBP00_00008611 [Phytophthora kernoviae]|uniref:Endonuclease/exonuclease/phosphatase domain-containing protein n=1 Tax=Phytophthora kernoviae TaxID=325452 RepID=A0A3F2REZ6_9STRA|nr:hypothetical protein BBP00_00008611 [Phytophthora kernoviae]
MRIDYQSEQKITYSPHSGWDLEYVDKFYADLHAVLAQLPRRDTTFVLGDFNAKIGRRRDREIFMGIWGRGRRNRNRNRNDHVLAYEWSFCY